MDGFSRGHSISHLSFEDKEAMEFLPRRTGRPRSVSWRSGRRRRRGAECPPLFTDWEKRPSKMGNFPCGVLLKPRNTSTLQKRTCPKALVWLGSKVNQEGTGHFGCALFQATHPAFVSFELTDAILGAGSGIRGFCDTGRQSSHGESLGC